MPDLISILIPTKGRIDGLQDLLGSLSRMDGRESIPHEIMVVNNAADEGTAESVKDLSRLTSTAKVINGDTYANLSLASLGL